MSNRRILSLWFPRLAAERVLRHEPNMGCSPFAIVSDRGNMQVLTSLSAEAEAEGLTSGQPLRDAQAMCPKLATRLANPVAEAAFLSSLRRWAGKFSPWVAEEPPAGLVIDLTGCAHLFGGEDALLDRIEADCADLGLTVRSGIADTLGAAWALARYAGQAAPSARSSDAIDQEAWATRSRAARRRHWERGGAAPVSPALRGHTTRIARPGQTRTALGPLPVAALRLPRETVTDLTRLGMRRIEDLSGQPRAGLARRFGQHLVQRLDQAMGIEPEPISPAKPPSTFAVRLTLPDPIGLEADIVAALDRLLPELESRLRAKGRGARRVRLECHRVDQAMEWVEVGLARPSASPDRIRPLLLMKIGGIDAGFGIDRIRLDAFETEPAHARQQRGSFEAATTGPAARADTADLDDLIGKLGARVGLETITRMHPADSHIPERSAKPLAAAWSEAAEAWPKQPAPRPLLIWRPEPVTTDDGTDVPLSFRWRRRDLRTVAAIGPERIAPEWWLDDPDWRSGIRDYWRVTIDTGEALWLYYAHGGTTSGGWFCQGSFR